MGMPKVKSKYIHYLYTIIGIVLVVLVWWLLALIIDKTLFPAPNIAFQTMFELLGEGYTWKAIGGTLYRLIIAFLMSFVAALIFGVFGGISKIFRTIFNPFVVVLRTIPTAAVIFVLIILLKPTNALYIIDFLLMFPILYEAVSTGVKNIDKTIIDAMRLDSGKRDIKAITSVIVPMAWPYIILGIIQSLGLGMKVSIMSEVLCGDNTIPGLGRMISTAYQETNVPVIFAVTIIAILLIAVLDIALKLLKRKYKTN